MKPSYYKWLILVMFMHVHDIIQSQTPFNKLTDFDGAYFQMAGESLLELDGLFYGAGVSIAKSDSLDVKRNLAVTSFNQRGEPINTITWRNDIDNIQNTLFNNNENLIYNDHIYYAVETNGAGRPCIVYVDKSLSELHVHTCIEQAGSDLLFPQSMVEFPEGYLTMPLANEQTKFHQLVARVSLTDPEDWQIIDHSQPDELTIPYKIFKVPDEDKVIVAAQSVIIANGNGQDPNTQIALYFTVLDKDLNVVDRKYHFDNINATGADIDGLINDEGEIIMTVKTFDRQLWNQQGVLKYRPHVMKFNPDLSVAWNKPFTRQVYGDSTENHVAIIESHDKDGYIITGYNLWKDYGMIGKVSTEGDSVWHYVIRSLYEVDNNLLQDVIRTEDGHYLASGRRGVYTNDDSLSSFSQLWLVKFDENGLIVNVGDTTTSTEEISPGVKDLRVYPNPSADMIFIQHKEEESIRYDFVDSQGRVLKSAKHSEPHQIMYFSVDSYPAGIYYLLLYDKDNRLLRSEKIVVVD
jgi:hypothetical protein